MIGAASEGVTMDVPRERREPWVSWADVAVVGLLLVLVLSARLRLLSFIFGDS